MAELTAAAAVEPEVDLPDRVLQEALLSPDDHKLLLSLVDEAINEHGGDAQAALDWIRGTESIFTSLTAATTSTKLEYKRTPDDAESDEEYLRTLQSMPERPGRYWLKSEHARGGQGRLLIVHDEALGRDIILKELLGAPEPPRELPTPIRRSASLIARFLQEAKITSQLEHPSIIPVYEVGLRPDRTPYYTMKLLKGKTLSAAFRECKTLGDRLALVRHFADICHGVAYAHSRGVIHRDLKPGNVMIGEFGETVILDWGLAKVLGKPDVHFDAFEKTVTAIKVGFDSKEGKTVPGAVLGTPAYMSPEQARGELLKVDKRSDVYGLGMILYELIAGRLPFEQAPVSSILYTVANEEPPPCTTFQPEAPPELVAICDRCLSRDADKRYQDAAELAEDIDRFTTGALVAAYSYSFRDVVARYYRRHRIMVNTIAAFVITLIALGAYSYVNISIARDREAEARAAAEDGKYVTQMHLIQSSMEQNNFGLARETLWATNPSLNNWEWGYLLNNCYRELYTLEDCVTAKYSPDGTRLATSSRTEPIEIRNADDGSKIIELSEQSKGSLFHEYSPDGTRLVSVRLDGAIHVWDAQTGRLIARMLGDTGRHDFARFDNSGHRIVSSGNDGSVYVWEAQSGAAILTIEDQQKRFYNASFSHDGQTVVFVSSGRDPETTADPNGLNVIVWELAGNRACLSVPGSVYALSPNGVLAVADGVDIVVVAVPTGEVQGRLSGHAAFIRDIAFSRDGRTVISGALDGTVRAHDLPTGKLTYEADHGRPVVFVRTSPDGKRFLTASSDCTIRVWDTATGHLLNTLRGHEVEALFTVEFNSDGSRIASGAIDQTVKVWNAESSPGQRVLATFDSPINRIALSPDGKLAAVALSNRTMEIRRTADGAILGIMASYAHFGGSDMAFSPDSRRVVAALDEFSPAVWDIETQRVVSKFTSHLGPVYCVAFSPDGRRVVSGSWDNTARVWDPETGAEVLALTAHTDTINDVAYSPDGRYVGTVSEDGAAILWDIATGTPYRKFELEGSGHSVAFSHDGRLLAAGIGESAMRIWDIDSGELVRAIAAPKVRTTQVSFSRDDSRLAIAGLRAIQLWSVRTGDSMIQPTDDAPLAVEALISDVGDSIFVATDSPQSLVEMIPAAWNANDIARVQPLPEGERASALRGAHTAAPRPVQNSVSMTVATTPQYAGKAIANLADAIGEPIIRTESIAVDGAVYDALARLCVQRGDELLEVNGVPVNSQGFLDAVRSLAASVKPVSPPEITFAIRRNGIRIAASCQLIEPVVTELEKSVDIEVLRDYFSTVQRDEMVWKSVMLQNLKDRAAEIGEPATDENSINGVWLGESRSADVKPALIACGLALDDRIVTHDGKRIVDYATLHELGKSVLNASPSDPALHIQFEVEKGQFQSLGLHLMLE